MSKTDLNEIYKTELKDEQFLYFADNSNLAILLVQKGYIKYCNKKFEETLGYTQEEVSQWKKREFFKIIYPEDLNQLLENLKIEDTRTVSFQFRAITKEGKIITIETFLNIIKHNNERAYIHSLAPIKTFVEENGENTSKTIKIKTGKKIILDYLPEAISLLKEHKIDFEIIKHSSYQEEN